MSTTFLATLSPMLVMFSCIVIGFVLKKKRILPDNAASVLSSLENFVFVPALIINTFMNYCTVATLSQHYRLVIYSIIAVAIAMALAHILAPLFTKDKYIKHIYHYSLTFGNFGFLANSIVPALFGDEMLYYYMLFTLPLNTLVYTWGCTILIPQGEEKKSPLKNLINPVFIAILIGATLGLSGATTVLPKFFSSTVSTLGACMGPVAMLLTGMVVGGYEIKSLLSDKKIYVATLLRLFVFPAFLVAVLKLLGADEMTLTFTIFAFGAALGLNSVVFPAAYGGDTKPGASMAIISHTLAVVTIPIMYSLLTLVI